MKKYRAAAVLMFIHGGFMEIGGCIAALLIPLIMKDTFDIESCFSFIVPYLQENMTLMLIMGALYGVIRIVSAIGLWKNRMWGLVSSVIVSVITLTLMTFMLPAGIMDGIFAFTVLMLILTQYFGKKKIIEE